MTPIDFVGAAAESNYNAPAGAVQEAFFRPIRIFSSPGEEWEVLSYYFDPVSQQMLMDIQKINGN